MKASKVRARDRIRCVAAIAAIATPQARAFDLINTNLVGPALMFDFDTGQFHAVAPELEARPDATIIGRWHRPGGMRAPVHPSMRN